MLDVLALVGAFVVPLALLAIGVIVGDRYRDVAARELSWGQRVLAALGGTGLGLGAGLSRMARLLPKSWSDHPESKYPRHPDHWPPR